MDGSPAVTQKKAPPAAELCSVLWPAAREFLVSADNAADKKLSACHCFELRYVWGHPVSVIGLKLPVCTLAHFISRLEKCAKKASILLMQCRSLLGYI